MPSSRMRIGFAFAIVAAGCGVVAQAAPPASRSVAVARSVAPATGARSAVRGFGAAVDQYTLASLSGGANVSENITITGSVSNTATTNVSTGYNWIGGGAFGGAAGLPMVIQNSGNSVLIQNATVVNVQLQP